MWFSLSSSKNGFVTRSFQKCKKDRGGDALVRSAMVERFTIETYTYTVCKVSVIFVSH